MGGSSDGTRQKSQEQINEVSVNKTNKSPFESTAECTEVKKKKKSPF